MEEWLESVARWRADMRFPRIVTLFVCIAMSSPPLLAQSPNGNINGLVSDPSSGALVGAEIVAVNDATGVQYTTKTNNEGIYVLPSLPPGSYRLQVSKVGFKTIIKPDIVLNVQDAVSINFTLPIGAVFEVLTVQGGAPLVNTESATVSTVVDRQFAENLPMNGRSFQSLIELTPGVVVIPSNSGDTGQFSVNGQRGASNYWMLDGVSANIGIGATSGGNGISGAAGSFSALGGTNGLVSVDALQEFRIQTSTFAPEFGRTPGAQISISTRSGTNQFHGTAFDYLRNDVLDATNWFNGYVNNPPLPKARERQNDFGGTVSGPILKSRTFFFLSYEGLRLRLPQTTLTGVPDSSARQSALAALRPYLNAYPLPNGSDNASLGIAQFNASYSDPAGLDAYSVRIDHRLSDRLTLFARYNHSPSSLSQRGANGSSLSSLTDTDITTGTATLGATWTISPTSANDLRFNYSRTAAESNSSLDTFGGAIPLSVVPYPTPYSPADALFDFGIFSLQQFVLQVGKVGTNVQRQVNLVDSLLMQRGTHGLKFGVDFRRLSPKYGPAGYQQQVYFNDVPSAENGILSFADLYHSVGSTFLFRNLGLYLQDTWRATPRLTVTYGLRWDVDFAPRSLNGPSLASATGFSPSNLSNLALAPAGTPPFSTRYGNVAPRIGVAYQFRQAPTFQTVLRGGFGVFNDLATSEIGNILPLTYPFAGAVCCPAGSFPLSPAIAAAPPILPPNPTDPPSLHFVDPHLEAPRIFEWNLAVEQGLGEQQVISATYSGAVGRRLLQSGYVFSPNPDIAFANFVTNGGTSDYHALQIQFQRHLSRGLQALASYTWSHSIDTGSAGSDALYSNYFLPSNSGNINRGPSDFDIRNSVSTGITYDIPSPRVTGLLKVILKGWSTQNFALASSAPPVDITDVNFFTFNSGFAGDTRPDFVPGQPLYLHLHQYPGGKAFNPAAFTNPPVDPSTGNPLRQGDVPRNYLRGFGLAQWDFAVHRDYPIHDALNLQFRVEMFNVLNHPNFGQHSGRFGTGGFGVSMETLGQFLNGGASGSGNLGGGAFSPLYQIGGPRSIQAALKLVF
jgi:hypothetical protein